MSHLAINITRLPQCTLLYLLQGLCVIVVVVIFGHCVQRHHVIFMSIQNQGTSGGVRMEQIMLNNWNLQWKK